MPAHKKRRILSPDAFHEYAKYELEIIGFSRRKKKYLANRLVAVAKLIRRVEIQRKNDRAIVRNELNVVLKKLGGAKSKLFTRRDRSEVWGALETLDYQDQKWEQILRHEGTRAAEESGLALPTTS